MNSFSALQEIALRQISDIRYLKGRNVINELIQYYFPKSLDEMQPPTFDEGSEEGNPAYSMVLSRDDVELDVNILRRGDPGVGISERGPELALYIYRDYMMLVKFPGDVN